MLITLIFVQGTISNCEYFSLKSMLFSVDWVIVKVHVYQDFMSDFVYLLF